ncbi:hypothetical protein Drorol1_Dr00019289 [Drosera rotundifolia]
MLPRMRKTSITCFLMWGWLEFLSRTAKVFPLNSDFQFMYCLESICSKSCGLSTSGATFIGIILETKGYSDSNLLVRGPEIPGAGLRAKIPVMELMNQELSRWRNYVNASCKNVCFNASCEFIHTF